MLPNISAGSVMQDTSSLAIHTDILFLLHTMACLYDLKMCDTDYVTDLTFRYSLLSDILSGDKPRRNKRFSLYIKSVYFHSF